MPQEQCCTTHATPGCSSTAGLAPASKFGVDWHASTPIGVPCMNQLQTGAPTSHQYVAQSDLSPYSHVPAACIGLWVLPQKTHASGPQEAMHPLEQWSDGNGAIVMPQAEGHHLRKPLRSSVLRRREISCPALMFTPRMQTGDTPTLPSGGISDNVPTVHLHEGRDELAGLA